MNKHIASTNLDKAKTLLRERAQRLNAEKDFDKMSFRPLEPLRPLIKSYVERSGKDETDLCNRALISFFYKEMETI